jgi:hypothetical protein
MFVDPSILILFEGPNLTNAVYVDNDVGDIDLLRRHISHSKPSLIQINGRRSSGLVKIQVAIKGGKKIRKQITENLII